MRVLLSIVLGIVLLGLSGCGPSVSREQLGEILFEVPKVPGSDEPYPLPDIPAPDNEAGASATDQEAAATTGVASPAR